MNKRKRSLGLAALGAGLMLGLPSDAVSQEAPVDSLELKVQQLESRIGRLEARIDSLLSVLAGADIGEATAEQPDTAGELAALREAAAAAAGELPEEEPAEGGGSRTRNLNVLNPEFSATGDIVSNYIAPSGGANNASFVPREFEFSVQAALDPFARTKIFITREEDFEIAGLAEDEAAEEAEGGDFEIEEGYAYWVGLPLGFGAKAGKMRQEIGLYNRWHTHALLDVERPLAAQAFLGEDGLIQTGASVTLPTLGLGPSTQTATVEVTAGSNDALFAGGNEISYLANLRSFWDLGSASYVQFGATGVYGENDEEALTSKLLGLDFSYRWNPPGKSLYRDLNLKAEWYFVDRDIGLDDLSGNGGYFQANFRFARSWLIGARADFLDPYGDEPDIFQFAPNLTWWQSEWVRFRLQYNYVKPDDGGDNHTVLLQSVWSVGPHKHETY